MKHLQILFSLLLTFALIGSIATGEGLKAYKKQKHRKVKKDSSGEVVTKTCEEAFLETCLKNCSTNTACQTRCRQDVDPYCRARAKKRSKASEPRFYARATKYLFSLTPRARAAPRRSPARRARVPPRRSPPFPAPTVLLGGDDE